MASSAESVSISWCINGQAAVVVLDPGSGTIKAGVAGDDAPVEVPNIVGYSKVGR